MSGPAADALVLFGITGDLARKKLFGALYALVASGRLDVPVIGVAADDWTDEDLRRHARRAVDETVDQVDEDVFGRLGRLLHHVSGDYRNPATFVALRHALGDVARPVCYLAIPPSLFSNVAEGLVAAGCTDGIRIMLESPSVATWPRPARSMRCCTATPARPFRPPVSGRPSVATGARPWQGEPAGADPAGDRHPAVTHQPRTGSSFRRGTLCAGQVLPGDKATGPVARGYVLVFAACTVAWAFLVGRLPTRPVLAGAVAGVVLASGALIGLNHGGPPPLLVPLVVAGMFLEAGFAPAALTYLADTSADFPTDRGVVMGVYSVVLGVGYLAGNVLGGLFAQRAAFDGLAIQTIILAAVGLASVAALPTDRRPGRSGVT